MISVEEALDRILTNIIILEPEEKPILESLGQVLAENVYSEINVPQLDNSAMDGYAVRWESIKGTTRLQPKILKVIGQIAAGDMPSQEVTPGTAVRIMTGAPIPKGTDTVVRFEDTDEETRNLSQQSLVEIGILREIPKGSNIRQAGEDVRQEELVLAKGTVLRPQEIGVLASLGHFKVLAIRRPIIAILTTGNELVEVGHPLQPGKIYNSNAFSIAAQVEHDGGIPKILGNSPDEPQVLSEMITQALDSDLLITSAGISAGTYDVVKDVLAQLGKISFWTVRMKPGKPLAFGILKHGEKEVPYLGLPGNPVSSMISFEQFVRPAILKLQGKKNVAKPVVSAISESSIRNRDGRRIFARVMVRKRGRQYFTRLTGPQGSGILTSMTRANGLMIVPEEVEEIKEGDEVLVQMLDWEIEQED